MNAGPVSAIPYAELPKGWYCVAMSVGGYGVYLKKVRDDSLGFSPGGLHFSSGRMTTYRVIFNGFMGGWIIDVDRREGNYMVGGQAFNDPLAAIVAAEVEIATGGSV